MDGPTRELVDAIRGEFWLSAHLGRLIEFAEQHRPAFERLAARAVGVPVDPCGTAFDAIVRKAILDEEAAHGKGQEKGN